MKVVDRRSVILGPSGEVVSRPVSDAAEENLVPLSAIGSFRGVLQSEDRGLVWVPTLDSKKTVDHYSRVEGMKRARFFLNNGGGLGNRVVWGVARMIVGSGLLPRPIPHQFSGAKAWSRKVRDKYMRRAGNPLVYDLSQRRSVFAMQHDLAALRIRDGDAFVVLALDDTGRLRRRLYEGHQVGNGVFQPDDPKNSGWWDGVKCGRYDEPVAYRVLGWDEAGKESRADVPAGSVMHFMDRRHGSARRGITRLVSSLNTIYDRGEIMAAITKGVKVTSQVAYVIEQAMQQGSSVPGAPGSTLKEAKPTKNVDLGNGKKVTLEEFLGGGEARELKPGQEFKIVQAENPHPNTHAHLNEMIRSIAYDVGYSPEVIWNGIAMGGANSRFMLADAQQQIEREQEDLVDAFLGPDYVAWLWDEIQATRDLPDGHPDKIEEVDGWERHGWIYPGRLTVDFGRDNKAYIELYKRGLITMRSMYGLQGYVSDEHVDEYLDERRDLVQGIYDRKITQDGVTRSMTYEEAFPEQRQTPVDETATNDASNGSNADFQALTERLETSLKEIEQVIAYAREPKS